jgi:hypothetical protein
MKLDLDTVDTVLTYPAQFGATFLALSAGRSSAAITLATPILSLRLSRNPQR